MQKGLARGQSSYPQYSKSDLENAKRVISQTDDVFGKEASYHQTLDVKTHDISYQQYKEASLNLKQKIETREKQDSSQIWSSESAVNPAERIKANREVQIGIANFNKSVETYNLITALEASKQLADQEQTAAPSGGPSAFGSITNSNSF